MSNEDQYFKNLMSHVPPFEFNQKVADVFDDMVQRSVPFYQEVHRLIIDLLSHQTKPNQLIMDLGCSTGTTICLIEKSLPEKKFSYIGIDNSAPMIEKAQAKLDLYQIQNAELLVQDINLVDFKQVDHVIMNYTLQFIPLEKRNELVKKIFQQLPAGGMFILSEKIKTEDDSFHSLVNELYYDFKRRNGYSELEISQKREALENVLIPLKSSELIKLLNNSGFKQVEMIFRWYNFASFVGIK
jgi:tRNA (cmo5U34)-methyltransferase